jgi:hypothetical protein
MLRFERVAFVRDDELGSVWRWQYGAPGGRMGMHFQL